MTYNGIGLRTPRGSGTNGYIQRNLAHISRPRQEFIVGLKTQRNKRNVPKPNKLRVDKGIMDHNRKRQIEVLVFKERCKYEDQGKTEDEIEKLTNNYRQRLLHQIESGIDVTKPEYVINHVFISSHHQNLTLLFFCHDTARKIAINEQHKN